MTTMYIGISISNFAKNPLRKIYWILDDTCTTFIEFVYTWVGDRKFSEKVKVSKFALFCRLKVKCISCHNNDTWGQDLIKNHLFQICTRSALCPYQKRGWITFCHLTSIYLSLQCLFFFSKKKGSTKMKCLNLWRKYWTSSPLPIARDFCILYKLYIL